MIKHRHIKRGFNLIEAAIILAIAGLVVGSIWVASSYVKEQLNQSETIKIVVFAADKLTNELKTVPTHTYTDEQSLLSFAIGLGAIPADAKTPYDAIDVVAEDNFSGRDFKIYLYAPSKGTCIAVVSKFANGIRTSQLTRVAISSSSSQTYTTFPIAMSEITARCIGTITLIGLQFKY